MWLRKKEKKKHLKSLIRFHSANKLDIYNRGGKRKKKKSKRIHRTSQNIRIISVSWVTAVRVLYLNGSHSPPHFPRMASNTVLISGPVAGAVQIIMWSYSVFLPLKSTAIRTFAFFFFFLWELSMTLYIFHRHRVCLVDWVDLIWSLYCSGGKVLGLLP